MPISLPLLVFLASGAALPADLPADVPSADDARSGLPLNQLGAANRSADEREAAAMLVNRPLTFLENVGQWDSPARFAAHRGPVTVAVEPHVLTVTVDRDGTRSATAFHFEGASDGVSLEPLERAGGAVNLYSGNDRDRWAEGLVPYAKLALRGLHDGIDVVVRSQGGHVEYDVLLDAGADLDQLIIRCEGVDSLRVDETGGLLLETADGVLRQSPPVTWQVLEDGTHEPIECRFVVIDETRYGFALPDHDTAHDVVIDPGLEWSTYLGGAGDDDLASIGRDSAGRIVVGGYSDTVGWALPGGTVVNNGLQDSFIAVLDPTQTGAAQLVWWTSFGGNDQEIVWDLVLNAADDVFTCGFTFSNDFPTTANAYASTVGGNTEGFVTRLAANNGALVYSSLLGGSAADRIRRIQVEEPGRVTVAGTTGSTDLPATANAYDMTANGGRDNWVAILDTDQSGASSLQYLSYFGGSSNEGYFDERQIDIAYLPSGELVLAGSTQSSNLPIAGNPFQAIAPGGQNIYVAILDPAVPGTAGLTYSTYIGGSAGDGVSCVGVDIDGSIIVTGFTYGTFPTTGGAPFKTFEGPSGFNDAVIVKIDPTATGAAQLVYSTLITGTGYEGFWDFEMGADGTFIGVGFTNVPGGSLGHSLPVTCNAYDKSFNGEVDGMIVGLTPGGKGIDDVHYVSFFGTAGNDILRAIDIESLAGTPLIRGVGGSNSDATEVTPGAFQTTWGGGIDGVVFELRLNPWFFCEAGANSVSPDGARICVSGPVDLASNALDLSVSDLPQFSFGYFLMSTTAVPAIALPAPSQGSLCLGGTVVRFAGFAQSSGASGEVLFRPDLMNIPPPGAPLSPGDTAHFQYWYRDIGGASNTSNGVSVTLE